MKNCLSPERMLEIEKIISKQNFDNVEELLHNEYEINYYKVAFKLPKKFFDVMLEIETMSLNKRDNIIIEYISNKFKISEDLVKIRLEQVYMMNDYLKESQVKVDNTSPRVRVKKNNEEN
jgi:hypothetical protein